MQALLNAKMLSSNVRRIGVLLDDLLPGGEFLLHGFIAHGNNDRHFQWVENMVDLFAVGGDIGGWDIAINIYGYASLYIEYT